MVRGEGELSTVRTASDYSYSASSYAGENYRMVGDAAGKFYCTSSSRVDHIVTAFIDPFFSSGVHLALTSGLSAAASIAASIRGDCPEPDAAEWHTQRVGLSYTRYALLRFCVLQLSSSWRSGSSLSSWVRTNKCAHNRKMSSVTWARTTLIKPSNFCDLVHTIFKSTFRPTHRAYPLVIQGNADLGPRLSESEVQNALDFCVGLFNPVNPGLAGKLRKHLETLDDEQFSVHGVEKTAFLDPSAPPLPVENIRRLAKIPAFLPALEKGSGVDADLEAEVQCILEKMNARRLIHREYGDLHSLEDESLGAGYKIRLERGRLGLVQDKTVN